MRIIRDRYLTPEEAAKYNAIRDHIEANKEEIMREMNARPPGPGTWEDLWELLRVIRALRDLRERRGLSREEVAEKAMLKVEDITDLEEEFNYNPPISFLSRYAMAVDYQLVLGITAQTTHRKPEESASTATTPRTSKIAPPIVDPLKAPTGLPSQEAGR